jgi:hypothetical protein
MSGSFLTGPPREAEQGGRRRAGEDFINKPLPLNQELVTNDAEALCCRGTDSEHYLCG